MLVENQKDIMTIERYVRILYAPARLPKDRLLDALEQIDNIHKERPAKQKKLRKMLDDLYRLYSQSPTLEIDEMKVYFQHQEMNLGEFFYRKRDQA